MATLYSNQLRGQVAKRLSGAHSPTGPLDGSSKLRFNIGTYKYTSALTDENGAVYSAPVVGDHIALVSVPGNCRIASIQYKWDGAINGSATASPFSNCRIADYTYVGDDGKDAIFTHPAFVSGSTATVAGNAAGSSLELVGQSAWLDYWPERKDGRPLEILFTVQNADLVDTLSSDVGLITCAVQFLVE